MIINSKRCNKIRFVFPFRSIIWWKINNKLILFMARSEKWKRSWENSYADLLTAPSFTTCRYQSAKFVVLSVKLNLDDLIKNAHHQLKIQEALSGAVLKLHNRYQTIPLVIYHFYHKSQVTMGTQFIFIRVYICSLKLESAKKNLRFVVSY